MFANLTHLVSGADAPVSALYHFPVHEADNGVLWTADAAPDTGI